MLMFSSLHVSLVTVTCRCQHKGQPSPVRDSHLWTRRSLSAFLSILYLLVLLSPTGSFHLSLMQVLVCWVLVSVHGKWWEHMAKNGDSEERKMQFCFGQSELFQLTASPEVIHIPNAGWLAKSRSSKAHKTKHMNRPSSLQSSYALNSAFILHSAGWEIKLAKHGVWSSSLLSNTGLSAARVHSVLFFWDAPIEASMWKVPL